MNQTGKKWIYLFVITLMFVASCRSLSELSFSPTTTPTKSPAPTQSPSSTPSPTPNQRALPTQKIPFPILSGSKLSFDGVDDWVVIDDSSMLEFATGDFTISVWLKTNKLGTQQQIIRKGYDHLVQGEGRWVLSIDDSGVIRIVVNDIAYPETLETLGTTSVVDGRWHHVAAVFDRDDSLKVYLDGNLELQDPSLTQFSSRIYNQSIVKVYIGRANSSGLYFEGMLSDLAIWRCTRTQQEIQTDQIREINIQDKDLIAYWSMREGEGQTIVDSIGFNHGQLCSTPYLDINDPTWYYSQ